MRLVCPNCDAQYELAPGALTDAGRDVQCSNCGHTWFQLPPELEAERDAEEELFGTPAPARAPVRAVPAPVRPPPVAPHAAPAGVSSKKPLNRQPQAETSVKSTAESHTADLEQQETAKTLAAAAEKQRQAAAMVAALNREAAAPFLAEPKQGEPAASNHPETDAQSQPPVAPRRALDESLKAVLREEAEREVSVRRSQTPRPLETQTDLGLQETSGGASAAKAVRDRLARLRGQEPEPEGNDKPTARRDLLPDIEEINSTLRASSENRSGDEAAMATEDADAAAANDGFRSGFSLMLLIAVVLITAYVAAPKIIEQFPAAEAAMNSYVAGVDVARAWLDNAMRKAIATLQNLTSGSNS
ncbi:zinc-ribbon domain-containing protein [Pseudorhodobacter sp. W20_MBD10_FR17]|uniref:zinc-ribbon domain-containing protein n=1 Tax=Pseudorhodobacter sp. W20_MBD10_FR17 TaxID=3240266 RepID=UPI003F9B5CF4